MNIVYGISGFGQGHVARSSSVLKALLARGHRLAVMGFDNSARYIQHHHPDIPLLPLKVPVLHPAPTGLDFGKIADDPANHYADGIQRNFRAMQDAIDLFGGPPDLVISDYELVAAQFAYATLRPLVTIDQHSKYPGFQFPPVDGYTRLEDYARLNLFFPAAAARFACSFFPVDYPPNPDFPVTLIPPILRQAVIDLKVRSRTVPRQGLVYLSPFAKLPQSFEAIYQALTHLPDWTFHIFGREAAPDRANLRFYAFDTARFLEILGRCAAVITTAGHTLLSELVYLGKPVCVLPITTFDQQTCAQIIADNGLGLRTTTLTPDILRQFIDQLPDYRANLAAGRGLMKRFDGLAVLMEHLAAQFGV